MMKKYLLALVIALVVLLYPTLALAQTTYSDVPAGYPAADSIYRLTTLGVVGGSGGQFLPDAGMTRAQFAVIACRTNGVSAESLAMYGALNSPFKDVAATAWYLPYVNACFDLGLMLGSNGRFNPDAPVTRAGLVTVVLRAIGYSELPGSWPGNYLDKAYQLGLLNSSENYEITRAEMAQIVDAALDLPLVYQVQDSEAAELLRQKNLTVDADNYLLMQDSLLSTVYSCTTQEVEFSTRSRHDEGAASYLFYAVGNESKWAPIAPGCWGADSELDMHRAVLTFDQSGQVIFIRLLD